MKRATIFKLVLVAIALCSWGGWYHLYGKFVNTGVETANPTHSILVNDHGSVVFITPNQDHVLTALIVVAAVSFVCAVAIDLYDRKRGRAG